MTNASKYANRYWGAQPRPTSKAEFFNAVTTPAPAGGGTVATIRMFGPIDSWGGYWGINAKDIGAVLDALPESVSQIILRINSPGGEVFEGIAILNMLRAHRASVTAVVDGLAASAASVIAAGCDECVMSPGTQMMIHSPWVFCWGNARDLRKEADVLDGIERSLTEIYAAKAGDKDWPALLADETWLTATDAVELGLVDRVAVIPDEGEAATVADGEVIILEPVDPDDDFEDSIPIRIVARARASQTPVSTEPGTPNRKETLTMSDAFLAGVRDRLGVTDANASEETVLAALDEALAEQFATTIDAGLPAGVTAIDSAVLADLQAAAAQGVAARAEQTSARRAAILTTALSEGRIAPASRDTWAALLEENEEHAVSVLNTLPKNTIPVAEIGHSDTVHSADDALYSRIYGTKEV